MKDVAVTGPSGFIGSHLLELLAARVDMRVRVLMRGSHRLRNGNIIPVLGDLMKRETLTDFIVPGSVVINCAYLEGKSKEENLKAAANLAEACAGAGISRLIHLSTAVVAGRAGGVVNEGTPCRPSREYESTKLAVENFLRREYGHLFEVVILRPTAVFGPGGKNLLKLADSLTQGSRGVNYLKSCLFDKRRMNLVCIANVVAAIVFLIEAAGTVGGEVFIVSDDEDQTNNYRDVERYILRMFSLADYPLPRLRLPPAVLSVLLRLAGRSNLNPATIYDGRKLAAAGFRKAVSFTEGLRIFTAWYRGYTVGASEPPVAS